MRVPHVLTVAGSDSGSGAGIQADLKACSARGVYCSTVITAVTAQNTLGVQGVNDVAEDFVREQLKSVLSDMHPDVVKTGMLPSPGIVKVLCQSLKEFRVRALVVDPVMISTSGDVLAGPSVLATFREELLPLADIVTPNLREASALIGGVPLETVADMRSAAKLIHNIGPRNVLVKGGDLPASFDAVDVLFDGKEFYEFRSTRIKTSNTHGTGCTLASSIAAELAKGASVPSAIKIAKRYVESALEYSKDILIGGGRQGPFDHLMNLKNNTLNVSVPRPFDPSKLLLYAVTDTKMNKKWGRSVSVAVKAAIEGGATIIQLREKDADTRDFLEAAKACLEICHSHGVPLLINDRIDIVLACDADGVHIGQSDMPARVARSLLGPDKIIGVTCKTPEQAEEAWIDGADYIGCGGVYPTNTKENNAVVGLDGLKTVGLTSKLPMVAIGGIGISNVKSVLEFGVPNLKGVAVVSALFDRESVLAETQNLLRAVMDSVKSEQNQAR
ncbi:thiamine biosynthesis protein [Perilla frutescens var. hirtella]|uniref:Thiamine biosynthesis protein n=1 Tax=Perilla frutescens var. hirtella TaxID=608512 RepID=A0AAD4JHN6_PERFH|nr:thiamine biosynthesis protein [Perilla frutescens var. frutescens]KAH6833280.1 thiamine biosynthesis protein [Perilla frutescens var. hirtella]